jgi:hypothetical protein
MLVEMDGSLPCSLRIKGFGSSAHVSVIKLKIAEGHESLLEPDVHWARCFLQLGNAT